MTASDKWLATATVAMFFQLLNNASLQAATYGTNSFADAFVTTGPTANLMNNNYGAAGSLGLSAAGLPKGEFQSVLRFDLAGAKSSFDTLYGAGQWSLQSVTLQLVSSAGGNPIFNTSAAGQFEISWMQNKLWAEGAGTPAAPSGSGLSFNGLTNSFISGGDVSLGTFSFGGGTIGTNIFSLTLSPSLSADILEGDLLSLRIFATDSTASYLFNSKDFGTATSRPLLTISVVPEPTAAGLSVIALTLFGIRHRLVRQREA